MKAITIWQPYAHLKVIGEKIYETRSWATDYRGPIAIHAAKRPVRQVIDALATDKGNGWKTLARMESLLQRFDVLDQLPTGAVIAKANLTRCNLIDSAFIAGLSAQELELGDFTPGRYAWEFDSIVSVDPPIPARGAQGLWNWEE